MELQSTAAHHISIASAFVNTPGKINIADFCHSSLRRNPGAPGDPAQSCSPPKKNGGLPGVWEFEALCRAPCGTTAMIPATKNGGLPGVWEFELDKNARAPGAPARTYPQVVHRISLGEFGSLPNSPRLFNYVARLLAFPPILLLLLGSRPLDLIDLTYQRSPSLEELLNHNDSQFFLIMNYFLLCHQQSY